MAAAAPAGVLVLESLRLLAGPGVYLARSEHTDSGLDLVGVELRPGGEGHRGGVKMQRVIRPRAGRPTVETPSGRLHITKARMLTWARISTLLP